MKTTFILTVLSFFLLACHPHHNIPEEAEAKDTINLFNDVTWKENCLFSDVVENINYYPIPTERNFLIGKTDKLIVTDSLFIIMDRRITHSVFAFSKFDEWRLCIQQHGNGPTDYLNLRDIFYEPENKEIGMLCNIKKRVLYYNLKGEYTRDQKLPYNTEMIQPIGEKLVMHNEYGENATLEKNGILPNLIYWDPLQPEEPVCKNHFAGPVNRTLVWCSNSWFSVWKDTVCIKPDHCNIVYHCTKDSIYPAHLLNTGQSNIDSRYWKKVAEKGLERSQLEEYCKEQNLCEITKYLESEKYIYFTCKQKGEKYQVLYSKTTGKTHIAEVFKNDIDMYASFNPKAIRENKLYGYLTAYYVTEQKNTLSEELTPKSLRNVEEGDNPIIVELTLKDF